MTHPALICVVGPSASGKSLLITALTEALRRRGRRVASVVLRDDSTAVFVLSNGGRVTVSRHFDASELVEFVGSIEPNLDVLLAEGFRAAGCATVQISSDDDHTRSADDADLVATVPTVALLGDLGVFATGEGDRLAALIEERLGGEKQESPSADGGQGFLGRWRRRGRR
ncbi:MAG: hypothetical protein K1X87_01830 [Dehalococcoidia bacterium]|nr:hypothetical protein [Dehalococcoidia bacterium]